MDRVGGHGGQQRSADGWVLDQAGQLLVHEDTFDGYKVRRYRPRIEGLFSRIERWTHQTDANKVFWRSTSKDNVITCWHCYRWIDLHGKGIPGILTEQGNAWFYKRNISPIGIRTVDFDPGRLLTKGLSLRIDTAIRNFGQDLTHAPQRDQCTVVSRALSAVKDD